MDPLEPGGATITIGFELHRATNPNKPPLGTIVAVEGGPDTRPPGRPTITSICSLPCSPRHDVLFVDARGMGTSSVINCPGLESYQGDYLENIRLCGEQLGASSDLYGTAFATARVTGRIDRERVSFTLPAP